MTYQTLDSPVVEGCCMKYAQLLESAKMKHQARDDMVAILSYHCGCCHVSYHYSSCYHGTELSVTDQASAPETNLAAPCAA